MGELRLGEPLSLLVDEFRRGRRAEIVAVTSQKVAHHFGDGDDGFVPVRPPVDWPAVAGGLIGTGDMDDDGIAEIVEATPAGLGVWSISTQMSREDSSSCRNRPSSRSPMIRSSRRGRRRPMGLLAPQQGGRQLRQSRLRGAVVQLAHPPLFLDGVAYLSADDWADLLGMRIRFEPESGRISGLRGFHFLVGRVGETQWIYDGRQKETFSRPKVQGGVLYLAADFARIVGADTLWEPYTRTLVVAP